MNSNFQGYLLKFQNAPTNPTDEAVFPHKYLAQKPKLKPNIRTDSEAYRDANYDLHRVTIQNHKSKLEFTTIGDITLEQKIEMEVAMRKGLVNELERKYCIKFWNDDVGENQYTTGEFYLVDPEYTPIKITSSTIVYDAITYTFVQY